MAALTAGIFDKVKKGSPLAIEQGIPNAHGDEPHHNGID